MSPLKLGTRASPLARWQANWVSAQLSQAGMSVELVPITTEGDVATLPLGQVGGQGLFTKEIQRALLDGRCDIAVHSLKDLPTATPAELKLGAVPPRAACGDVLVSRVAPSIAELPHGARVGTGSNRRRAQLLHLRADLQLLEIRGNVDTRLRKLEAGECDALVLAAAGLERLGLGHHIVQAIPCDHMLPAAGQGALGIEIRAHDAAAQAAVDQLNDPISHACVLAERATLAALQAGCLAPVGTWCRMQGDQLQLSAVVLSLNGRQRLTAQAQGELAQPERLGIHVAQQLLAQGAGPLIAAAR